MGFATKEQADLIFEALKERDAEREARLPDHGAALHQIQVARERLKSLGWGDGIYCPKNGDEFALIQWGSTGVHTGHYIGEWPTGHIYCGDFMIRPEGTMWKAIGSLSDAERADYDRSVAGDKEFMERQQRMFSALTDETSI